MCLLHITAKNGRFNFNICRACRRDYCFLEGHESIEDEFNPMLEPVMLKSSEFKENEDNG